MITVPIGHGLWKLVLKTEIDFTNISSQLIKYKNPSGITGQFTASVENIAKGEISYEVQNDDFDILGIWTLWAYVTDAQGKTGVGKPFKLKVVPEGEQY